MFKKPSGDYREFKKWGSIIVLISPLPVLSISCQHFTKSSRVSWKPDTYPVTLVSLALSSKRSKITAVTILRKMCTLIMTNKIQYTAATHPLLFMVSCINLFQPPPVAPAHKVSILL